MVRRFAFFVLVCVSYPLAADDFSNFRIPTNRVFRAGTSFDLNFQRSASNSHREYGPYYGSTWSSTAAYRQTANWRLDAEWFLDSDLLYAGLDCGTFLSEEVSSFRGNDEDSHSENRGYELNAGESAGGELDWYPYGGIAGANIRLSGTVGYRQEGGTGESRDRNDTYQNLSDTDTESWGQRYSFAMTIGPTLGRIRNVTAVADALVMEDRLIEESVLTGRLQQSTRQALAELLYKEPHYAHLHERPARFFWRDVEGILLSDSAYASSMSAYATQRIQEDYVGSLIRFRGWSISPSYRYSHYNERNHYWTARHIVSDSNGVVVEEDRLEDYNGSTSRSDKHLLGIRAQYAKPFGLRWQTSFDLEFFYTADPSYPDFPKQERRYGYGSAQFSSFYMIADRWLISGAGRVSTAHEEVKEKLSTWDQDLDFRRRHHWQSQASFRLTYFVEDRVTISASIYDYYDWSQSIENYEGWQSRDTHDTRIFVGFTYAIRGAGFAPYDGPVFTQLN